MESLLKKYLIKLGGFTDTIGSTVLVFKDPIKLIVLTYIIMALLPFVLAFIVLCIQAYNGTPGVEDKLIKLGSTIIGDSAITFVVFIMGMCVNGEKMLESKISSNSNIMRTYIKNNRTRIDAKMYSDSENIGKK